MKCFLIKTFSNGFLKNYEIIFTFYVRVLQKIMKLELLALLKMPIFIISPLLYKLRNRKRI